MDDLGEKRKLAHRRMHELNALWISWPADQPPARRILVAALKLVLAILAFDE